MGIKMTSISRKESMRKMYDHIRQFKNRRENGCPHRIKGYMKGEKIYKCSLKGITYCVNRWVDYYGESCEFTKKEN